MDGISLGHLVVADQALWAVQMPPPGRFHKSGDTCSPQTTDNLSIYAGPGQRPKSQAGKGDPPLFGGGSRRSLDQTASQCHGHRMGAVGGA